MLAQGALVCVIAVLLIISALIVDCRSIDRALKKLNEMPDERYLLPLTRGEAAPAQNPPRFTTRAINAKPNGFDSATVLPFPRAVAGQALVSVVHPIYGLSGSHNTALALQER
ncbi:MAG: hypothetical protein JWN13_3047 [Betaproteobacteria bacterium]|nr:hypothetical protein [Betaproteobacteria bacterium]